MSNCFLDIETIPQQGEAETKALIAESIQAPATMKVQATIDDWHNGKGKYAGVKEATIENAYRATALDGAKGQICSLAFAVGDGEILSFTDTISEHELLSEFFAALGSEIGGRSVLYVGHYIAGFDLKFIFHRSVILGIEPSFELPFNGRHKQDYFDNMIAWAGYKDRISQDNLCKALGIEGKPNDIDGSKVWDVYKDGGIDRIEEYNRDDVSKARQIYKRINFIKG